MEKFQLTGKHIWDSTNHPIAFFADQKTADKFFNAYIEKMENRKVTTEEIKAKEIIESYKEFNAHLNAGGRITKDSLIHFGIQAIIKK